MFHSELYTKTAQVCSEAGKRHPSLEQSLEDEFNMSFEDYGYSFSRCDLRIRLGIPFHGGSDVTIHYRGKIVYDANMDSDIDPTTERNELTYVEGEWVKELEQLHRELVENRKL